MELVENTLLKLTRGALLFLLGGGYGGYGGGYGRGKFEKGIGLLCTFLKFKTNACISSVSATGYGYGGGMGYGRGGYRGGEYTG